MLYGYCRISKKTQSIDRQIRNIKAEFPEAHIVQEAYTGRKINRPEWIKLNDTVKSGDVIVFDSVSRMSRNADEGEEVYFDLIDRGVSLVFLNEHYIDSDIYKSNVADKIELTGTDEDVIFKGINEYFRILAKKQIRIAFEQAQKEVDDLSQRTKGGIETARLNGKQIGQRKGSKLLIKQKKPIIELIISLSKDFKGNLSDIECMAVINSKKDSTGKPLHVSRNTYYKYKRELE